MKLILYGPPKISFYGNVGVIGSNNFTLLKEIFAVPSAAFDGQEMPHDAIQFVGVKVGMEVELQHN